VAGLDPRTIACGWMAGSSPATTIKEWRWES
jgi:hypothetical protein